MRAQLSDLTLKVLAMYYCALSVYEEQFIDSSELLKPCMSSNRRDIPSSSLFVLRLAHLYIVGDFVGLSTVDEAPVISES